MRDYIRIFIKFLKSYWIWIVLLLAYALITYFFKILNCPVKMIIGYPCPGCGMTRACMSILRFDFVGAFNYNPLVFILPFVVFIMIFHERPNIKRLYECKVLWILIFILVITVYVLRFIFVYPNVPMDYNHNNLLGLIIRLFK